MNPLHDVNVNITDAVRMNKCFFFIAQFESCLLIQMCVPMSDVLKQSGEPCDLEGFLDVVLQILDVNLVAMILGIL